MSTHGSVRAFHIYIKTYSQGTRYLNHITENTPLKLRNSVTIQLLKTMSTAKENSPSYNPKICKNTTTAYFMYQSLYLALLENPFLRSFCTQFLNILKHVQNNIFNMHWKEKKCLLNNSILQKEIILMKTNMKLCILNYILIHQGI